MKTATVYSSDLDDDLTASAHVSPSPPLRVITYAQLLREGDVVRLRDHQEPRTWHTANVTGVTHAHRDSQISTDLWPIAYVCDLGEIVELIEVHRTAEFKCFICRETTGVPVTLDDFMDEALLRRADVPVIFVDPNPSPMQGYCHTHATTVLD